MSIDVKYEILEVMKKKSIIEIFNEMDYEEEKKYKIQVGDLTKTSEKVFGNETETTNNHPEIFENKWEPKSFETAVEAAVEAQNIWRNSSALERADSLHNIWKVLKECSRRLSSSKSEALILLEYLDFYSDLIIQAEEYKSWRSQGVVLIVLSKHSPFFVLGATVPAALATGCSVVVLASEKVQTVSLFLKEIIAKAGLIEGLFNVVTDFDEDNLPVSKKINKVFFCGSYLSAQKFYAKNLSESFNFFCPYNTAALILESSDINASVDKIVQATWGKNPFFAVSTIVVQESIYEKFLKNLRCQIEQFISENKNSSVFRDVTEVEGNNKIIVEALNANASVEKSFTSDNKWSPTVIVTYQIQNIDEEAAFLKVLLCRTAKEGVTLINNCQFSLGVSIWSEISSQALEVSSMLTCPNIWINCHGVFQASEPLQPYALSGDCVLGGSDGILEYISFSLEKSSGVDKTSEDKPFNINKLKILQMAASAQQAFKSWQNIKNKRKYIKTIAESLNHDQELSKLSKVVCTYAHFCNIYTFSGSNLTQEFLVVKKKLPIGVILLVVNTDHIDIATLVSLITFPLVLGNGIIIILRDENPLVKLLIECYNQALPKNLLTVIIGIKAGMYLASDPNIQAIWLFDDTENSLKLLQTIRSLCLRCLKHVWVVPNSMSFSLNFFQKECLKNKVIWLTAVDQFP